MGPRNLITIMTPRAAVKIRFVRVLKQLAAENHGKYKFVSEDDLPKPFEEPPQSAEPRAKP